MKMHDPVDFVILWVDGNDSDWLDQERKTRLIYKDLVKRHECGDGNEKCRYRDMGTLRYWFRGVEEFAPWVNKIYFVTCGQKPEWLNENNPKLVLVDHKDYIPNEWLPTFNSNPIEMNLHKIKQLSEHFVLFNDDMFLLRPVTPDLYFRDGLPYLPCDMKINRTYGYDIWSKTMFNNYCVINQNFNMREAIKKHHRKWFNIRELGFNFAMYNLICYKINKRTDSKDYEHIPVPHLKSTFEEVWNKCSDILNYTSSLRFRTNDDVNHWLMCGWNQAEGKFVPAREYSRGAARSISTKHINEICSIIKNQSYLQVCLNDSAETDEAEECFSKIREAFEIILPKKSSFEK